VLKEFKEFAFGGSLVEVAVALVMALALVELVGSLIEHVIMPIIGIIFGEPSFDGALIATVNDSEIRFGSFLTALVTFVSIALAVFLFVVKPYRAYKARVASGSEEPAPPPEEIELLRKIADNITSGR
jgi:large conductance mechanosensitive channel